MPVENACPPSSAGVYLIQLGVCFKDPPWMFWLTFSIISGPGAVLLICVEIDCGWKWKKGWAGALECCSMFARSGLTSGNIRPAFPTTCQNVQS